MIFRWDKTTKNKKTSTDQRPPTLKKHDAFWEKGSISLLYKLSYSGNCLILRKKGTQKKLLGTLLEAARQQQKHQATKFIQRGQKLKRKNTLTTRIKRCKESNTMKNKNTIFPTIDICLYIASQFRFNLLLIWGNETKLHYLVCNS